MWGPKESQAAWRDLGGVEGANVLKAFKNANRETLSDARLRRIIQDEEGGSGDGERLRTAYVFGELRYWLYLRNSIHLRISHCSQR